VASAARRNEPADGPAPTDTADAGVIAAPADGRRHRSDGLRSRQAILTAAAELATVEGLDGLSIGRLAEHVGMSKSGLFAHFGSKEELQIATVDTALAIFRREVSEPARATPPGIRRLDAIADAFLSHLEREVFPGGCFFVSAAVELEGRPGRVRDHVRKVYGALIDGFAAEVRIAQELGELDPEADVDQLTYEIDALMLGANMSFVFFGDRTATDRARAAVRERLRGVSTTDWP
jgi:AcrR family transcriptional regulator